MREKIEPLFILGLPRSGSTLWSNIVDGDAEVFCFQEMHYLSPWRRDFRDFRRKYAGDLAVDSNLSRLVDALLDIDKTRQNLKGNFWIQIARFEPERLAGKLYDRLLKTERSDGDIFRALIEEATAVRGYSRCMVKFPVYVAQIARLREWYPAAPIVNITRDPRAIAASKTKDPGGTGALIDRWPWMRFPLRVGAELFVILQYNLAARAHANFKNDENYQLLYYEDLMRQPEQTIQTLCEFVKLTWSPEMLQPASGQPSSLTGERRGGIDAATAKRWQSALTPTEISLINRLTKGARAKYGFDPDKYLGGESSVGA